VKTEASSSPDLSPAFHFKFHPSSHDSLSHHHSTIPLYRFGAQSNLANTNNHWSPTTVSHFSPRIHLNQNHHHDFIDRLSATSQSTSPNPTMSYSDDYDDIAELSVGQSGLATYVGSSPAPGGISNSDRAVRRRSSKGASLSLRSEARLTMFSYVISPSLPIALCLWIAPALSPLVACDQCRKSKCKCERSGPNEPCKNCMMLGTCEYLVLGGISNRDVVVGPALLIRRNTFWYISYCIPFLILGIPLYCSISSNYLFCQHAHF